MIKLICRMPLIIVLIPFIAGAVSASEIEPIYKAAVINNSVIVNKLGASEAPSLDKFIAEIAKEQNIQFFLREAAYVSPNLDITAEYLNAYKSKTPPSQVDFSKLKLNPIIAIVNSNKVLADCDMGKNLVKELDAEFGDDKSGNYKLRLEQGKINIIKKANPLLIKLSEQYGISLLLQEAVYAEPNYDVTQDMILILNGQKNIDQLPMPAVFKKPEKVAFIDVKMYLESFKGMDQEKILKEGNQTIKELATQQGIGVVLGSSIYFSPSIDVTNLVVAQVKKKMDSDSSINQGKKK